MPTSLGGINVEFAIHSAYDAATMKAMSKDIKAKLDNLPDRFRVKLSLTNLGTYLAEIDELDTFTEVDTLAELDFAINDLVATYFDIPIKFYDSFRYLPADNKPILQRNEALKKQRQFQLFATRALQQCV